jgi:hypothetical protein
MRNRARSRELGQGLVEFAVIFPQFILLIAEATIQHAVREGARMAALSDDCAEIRDRTSDQSQGLLDPDPGSGDIEFSYPDGDDEGDRVDVRALYTYDPFFLGSVVGLFNSSISEFTMDVTGSSLP